MKLNKALIVLLTVFMLIFSAGAVSADDDVATADDVAAEDGVDADATGADDDAGDDGAADEEADDETEDETDDGELPFDIGTPATADASADGSDDGIDVDDAAKASSTDLSKNPAGNPILVLLVAIAALGTASIKRR